MPGSRGVGARRAPAKRPEDLSTLFMTEPERAFARGLSDLVLAHPFPFHWVSAQTQGARARPRSRPAVRPRMRRRISISLAAAFMGPDLTSDEPPEQTDGVVSPG